MFIPKEYEKMFGEGSLDRLWRVPDDCYFDPMLCHCDDGSPVLICDGDIIKVGKRRYFKIVNTDLHND